MTVLPFVKVDGKASSLNEDRPIQYWEARWPRG